MAPLYFSTYNYLTTDELPGLIPTMASVTDPTLAVKFISDAELVLDAFAGPGPYFYPRLSGRFDSGLASGATTLDSRIFGRRRPDYWAKGGVYITVISGADDSLIGERRLIVPSSSPNQVTLASGFSVDIPSGAQFAFRQESQFPRRWDQNTLGDPDLRPMLKNAVAAQVEYGIQFGSEKFGLHDPNVVTDQAGGVSQRSYGTGYSEARDVNRAAGLAVWVAPLARVYMRRLLSNTGRVRG